MTAVTTHEKEYKLYRISEGKSLNQKETTQSNNSILCGMERISLPELPIILFKMSSFQKKITGNAKNNKVWPISMKRSCQYELFLRKPHLRFTKDQINYVKEIKENMCKK